MSTPDQEFQPPPPPTAIPEAKPPRPPKMMIIAIIVFVLGLVLAGLGIAKIVTGAIVAGVFVVAGSILLFALSFIRLPAPVPGTAPMPFAERLFGMFYQPTAVFKNLRSYPRWVVAFVIIAVLYVIYSAAFTQRVTPERIIGHRVEKLVASGIMPDNAVGPMRENAQREIQEAKTLGKKFSDAISGVTAVFFLTVIVAALYLVGMLAFGGRMNFWQALAVAVYAGLPVAIVLKPLSLLLLYVKSPDDIHPMLNADNMVQDNLGILFTPADNPILFVIASFIGLTSFYKLWLTATGLRHGSYRASSGAAWGVALTLWILLLLVSMGMAALLPDFMS